MPRTARASQGGCGYHYIAALLNSAPATAALYFSSAGVHTQRYHAADAEKVRIESFAGSHIQRELSNMSKKCHKAAAAHDRSLPTMERAIDEKAAEYWGVSKKELTKVQEALSFMGKFVHGGKSASTEVNDE